MPAKDKEMTPQQALDFYKYDKADEDNKAIDKVETAIKARFPGDFAKGLADKADDVPLTKSEVDEQTKEANAKAAEQRKNNPKDVAQESKESPPGSVTSGVAVKPAVKAVAPVKNEVAKVPPKGGGKDTAQGGEGVKKAGPKAGNDAIPPPPTSLVIEAATRGDAKLDDYLNSYPQKSTETTEKLTQIKEMASVAKSFDGQLEGYVAKNGGMFESAKGTVVNFLGKKEMSAMFSENPYSRVQGGLGTLMQVVSFFENVTSVVGNIAGKLGMVLTVVGLLAMILGPIGVAIEAIARVLNVIGIVCDALGLVFSGVLTGLNGIVLARQIGKGSSNEEKAATCDMMASEATAAGGHIMSLALTYGGSFMKGFKGASKGVMGKLFGKVKSSLGKFASKTLGPVANWAKKGLYAMGIGLEKAEKAEGPGLLSKIWKSPEKLVEKVRETSLVRAINKSKFAKDAEQWGTKVSKNKFVNIVDSGAAIGESVGNIGSSWNVTKKLEASAAKDAEAVARNGERLAAADAGNRERAKIDRDISRTKGQGFDAVSAGTNVETGEVDDAAKRYAKHQLKVADKMERGQNKAVKAAEQKGEKDAVAANLKTTEKKAEEKAEKDAEQKEFDAFKKDPGKYQLETQKLSDKRDAIAAELESGQPLSAADRELKQKEMDRLEHEENERLLMGYKAAGGESIEHLWQAKKTIGEAWDAAHGKSEGAEHGEMGTKATEKASGHADTEAFEHREHHDDIAIWTAAESAVPQTAAEVEIMLTGLDDSEHDHDPDAGDEDDAGVDHEGDAAAAPTSAKEEAKTSPPSADQGGDVDAPTAPPTPAPAPVAAPAPAAAPATEGKQEEGTEVPELAYWPNLSKKDGDFDKAGHDLHDMKMVAWQFHKAQIEAKKKAIEAYHAYLDTDEWAKKKAAFTAEKKGPLAETTKDAGDSSGAALKAAGHTDEGAKQQNNAASGGAAKTETVDPGEKPSRWHPIKRIWWYVKKWASEKAAAVFGWIQKKITDFVLKTIVGISMDDLKAYTTALHHRMEFSKVAGTKGAAAAGIAINEQTNVSVKSKTAADQAMEDAQECDRNVTDSALFVKNVESAEQSVVAEQAKAKIFLASMADAVKAERAKKLQEQQKAAAEAKQAAPAPGAPGGPAANGPAPANAAPPTAAAANGSVATTSGPKKKKNKNGKAKPVTEAAVGKINSARQYVKNQATLLVQQLIAQRDDQIKRFTEAMAKKSIVATTYFSTLRTGEPVVTEMKQHTSTIIAKIDTLSITTTSSRAQAQGAASQLRAQAGDLDHAASDANQQLNWAFKSTYDAAKKVA